MLRAIQDRLPLDINIQRLGISLASKCLCCPESACEEVTHIFLHGSWAVQLWTHYQNIFQLDIDTASVLSCLQSWFTIPLNSTVGYLQRIVPILVFNELWRARNAAIFEETQFRLAPTIRRINQTCRWIMHNRQLKCRTQADNHILFYFG